MQRNRQSLSLLDVGQPVSDIIPLSGLMGWYVGEDAIGVGNGNPVDTWTDRSGRGYNLTQSGAARPTFIASALSGFGVLQFDGIDDYIRNVASSPAGTGISICAVVKFLATTAFNMIASAEEAAGTQYSELRSNGGGSVFDVVVNLGDSISGGAIVAGTWYKAYLTAAHGDDLFLWRNGTSVGNIPLTGTIDAINNFSVGGRMATLFANMQLAELMFYNRGLPVGDTTTISNYFSSRYGV